MDERMPETEPSGALVPPPKNPPTAVAASAPLPGRDPSSHAVPYRKKGWRGVVESALDGLDALAERIASAARLR
jgi:hypothetical protein